MRNLDVINPKDMRPSIFVGICACLPIVLSLINLPLAYGAAPNTPLFENPVAQLLLVILASSLWLVLVSIAFQWDWKAKYYGFSLLFVASLSLFAITPLFALIIYGLVPFWLKIFVLLFYVGSHAFWCKKFFMVYSDMFNNEVLRSVVYQEEADAVYYMRNGDQFLLEKYYKFTQMPRSRYFAIFIILGIALMPVMSTMREFTGMPFAYIFLLVAMIPVSWMSFGFATRAYLVFYLYPSRIKNATGKDVYVDIVGKHPKLDTKSLRENGVKRIKV